MTDLQETKCRTCEHSVVLVWKGMEYRACQYIVDTGVSRPCPAGDDCIVFAPSTKEEKIEKGRRRQSFRFAAEKRVPVPMWI